MTHSARRLPLRVVIEGDRVSTTIRVFLSLRFAEHRELAETLADRLRRYSFLGIYLDDGRADATTALRRSLRELQKCDVVVLLIGETLGPPDEEGHSIVEREFHEALALLKPVLAYHSPAIDERSPTWSFLREAMGSALVVGTLAGSVGEAAMCAVADLQNLSLGSGDVLVVGPLMNGAGLRDEADRLGFADRLEDRPWPEVAESRRELLQRQAWAFEAIDNGHPATAVEQLRQAQKVWPDDWLTNYALAWVVVNTGSRNHLRDGKAAGRAAVETAQRWRAVSGDAEREDLRGPIRLNASCIVLARLAMLDGDLEVAAHLVSEVLARSPDSAPALRERFRVASKSGDLVTALAAAEGLRQNHADTLVSLLHSSDLEPPFRVQLEAALISRMPAPQGPDDGAVEDDLHFDVHIARLARDLAFVLVGGRERVLATEVKLRAVAAELYPSAGRPAFALLETVAEHEQSANGSTKQLKAKLEDATDVQTKRADLSSDIAAVEQEGATLRQQLSVLADSIGAADRRVVQTRERFEKADDDLDDIDTWVGLSMFLGALIAIIGLAAFAIGLPMVVDKHTEARILVTVIGLAIGALSGWGVIHAWQQNYRSQRETGRWLARACRSRILARAERRLRILRVRRTSMQKLVADIDAKLRDLGTDHRRWEDGVHEVASLERELAQTLSRRDRLGDLRRRLEALDGVPADLVRTRDRLHNVIDHKDEYASWAALLVPDHAPFWTHKTGRPTTVTGEATINGLVKGGLPRSLVRDRLVLLVRQSADARWIVSDLAIFATSEQEAERFLELEAFVTQPHGAVTSVSANVGLHGH